METAQLAHAVTDCNGISFPAGTQGRVVRTPRGTVVFKVYGVPRTLVLKSDEIEPIPEPEFPPGTPDWIINAEHLGEDIPEPSTGESLLRIGLTLLGGAAILLVCYFVCPLSY